MGELADAARAETERRRAGAGGGSLAAQARAEMERRTRSAPAADRPWMTPEARAGMDAASARAGGVQGALDRAAPLDAAAQADIQQTWDQAVLADHPVLARMNEFSRGIPFAGSYVDEASDAIGGNGNLLRSLSGAMGRENPYETMGLNVGGGVVGAVPMAVGSGAALPTSLVGRAGLGAAAVGTEGLIYGAGEGQGAGRTANALAMGGAGAVLGGIIPVAGAGIRNRVNALMETRALRQAAAAAPTGNALRADAQALYDQAETAILPRSDFATAAGGMVADARRHGMDPMLTPTAARVAGNMEEAAGIPDPDMAWRELDTLRRQAGIPAGDVQNRTQSALGTRMIEGIDDFVESADPATGAAVAEARAMWGRLRRSEVIEQAVERARNTASGFENGLRIEFRKLLNNPRAIRGFSAEERAAVESVVRGTPMGNALRFVGTMGAPTDGGRSWLGATMGAMAGGGAGSALGGPLGAVAGAAIMPAIGTGARMASEAATRRAADLAQAVVNAGGVPAYPQVTNALRGALEIGALGGGRPVADWVSPYGVR